MEITPILVRQSTAPKILGMSEPEFNKSVRPFVTVIKKDRCVFYKYVDLQAWADRFVSANGKPAQEEPCQKEPQGLERKAKSGTLKKSSQVSAFDAALEKRNSRTRNASSPN